MRSLPNTTHEGMPRLTAPLAVAALVFGCLSWGARTLQAVDEGGGPMMAGGGDAIGSLPRSASLPPEELTGAPIPSIVLEGPSIEEIKAVVIDAWGDGYCEFTDLQAGGVRVELQGYVTLLIDRNLLETSEVRFGLDVSQGFSGGLAIITKNQQVLRTQELPVAGDLELPLAQLAESGVLDQGGLTLHSHNPSKQHHALKLSGSGGMLRLVSRE